MTERDPFDDWEKLALAGSGVLALGSIRPWLTLSVSEELAAQTGVPVEESAGGLAGDGIATLLIALLIAAALIVLARRSETGAGWRTAGAAAFSGLVTGLVCWAVYTDGQSAQDRLAAQAEAGQTVTLDVHASLFVAALGSVVLVVAGVLGVLRERRARGESPEPA